MAVESYKRLFGTEPKVKAIHAGLECGLFLEKYPSLDMVSFGPTLRGVHSPDERMLIPTVEKFWNHLLDVLAAVKQILHIIFHHPELVLSLGRGQRTEKRQPA